MATNNTPANILFKRGTQQALNAKIGTASFTDGTFYLTTDTNRLYVGNGSTTPALLNQTVQIVPDVKSLPGHESNSAQTPAKNDFYYCLAENILAVWSTKDGKDQWIQINPDTNTNTDTLVSNVSTPVVSSDATGVTVTFNIEQTEKDKLTEDAGTRIADIPVSFTIDSTHFSNVNPVSVGLTPTGVNNGAKISTIGDGSDKNEFVQLIAGANVSIGVSGDDITISSTDTNTTYDLEVSNNTLTFTNSETEDKTEIVLESSNESIEIKTIKNEDNKDAISFKHKEYQANKTTSTNPNSVDFGGSITVIDGLTAENGHITGYTENTITLPAAPEAVRNTDMTISVPATADKAGSLSVTIKDSEDGEVTGTIEEAFYYMVNGNQVFNQGEIDFYTKNEIDTKLNTIDALHYRGTVGGQGATVSVLPTENVKIGDTYKVITAGTYGSQVADIGDLFIATGTETNGIIGPDLQWTYIPSGDETDTTYVLDIVASANDPSIKLVNSVDNDDYTAVHFNVGDALTVKGELSGTNKTPTITYSHAGVECTETSDDKTISETTRTFSAIEEVEVNEQGHVTGYTLTEFTLPEDKDTTYSLSLEEDNKIKLTGNNTDEDTITVTTNNGGYLTINSDTDTDTLTINHKTYEGTLTSTPETAETLTHNGTFSVVTEVERDTGGHLTGYKTKTYTLPEDQDTHYSLSEKADVEIANNAATITTTLIADNNNESKSSFIINGGNSSNIQITSSENQINIGLIWGTF